MKLLASILLLLAPPVLAADYTVVGAQHSSVSFISKQMDVPVEGVFRKFSARIAVDPDKPEAGKATIEIDLNSFDIGNADANAEVAGKAWFDTQNYPLARFVSERITRRTDGRYDARGKMTIKGKTLEISTPFTLKPEAGVLLIDGEFPLKRLDYGIGSGVWSDTSVVEDVVQIRFHFSVARQ